MKSIISLVGARGGGKTTVGLLLSKRLGWKFLDSDLEIERLTGMAAADFFRNNKLNEFRDYEEAIISDAHKLSNIIIATGGGCVERPKTQNELKKGFCAWLAAEPKTLLERQQSAPRPPLTNLPPMQEIEFILDKRRSLYLEVAKIIVTTDALNPEEVCDAVQRAWQKI